VNGEESPAACGGVPLLLIVSVTLQSEARLQKESAVVYGRVVDAGAGMPVEEVIIEFHRLPFYGEQSTIVKVAKTDSQGNYRIDGIPAGPSAVVVRSRGFKETRINPVYFTSWNDNLLDLALEVGQLGDDGRTEISGVVRRANKTPVADASVTILNIYTREIVAQLRTDKDGKFQITRTLPGRCVIYATKPELYCSTPVLWYGEKFVELMINL
jgi:hypothetical protein